MKKIGVIVLIGILLSLGVFSLMNFEKKDRTVDEVLEAVWKKYDVQGYFVGGQTMVLDDKGAVIRVIEEPGTIDVDVYKEEDIEKVERYIMRNLSKEDLEYYEINVFSEYDIIPEE